MTAGDKVLVANRGEIAVRAFRAAYELGLQTVAVYTHADRTSLHRQKADEAYEIGDPARPLAPYLDPHLIVATARRVGATLVYPGYGFMSESPALAAACAAAGLTFVGPPADVLLLTGDKVQARNAAASAGLDVLRASDLLDDVASAAVAAEALGYPVFVKAAAGGGGRGLRRVEDPGALHDAVETAMREAQGAFGDSRVFLEQAVTRPRHVEVQVLADAEGQVVHLFERECSVQRRHQKVVEIAPAPNLHPEVRDRLCHDALVFARAVGYRNAGTVEFLVENAERADGRHAFIEMNPRIQVEHTVTEETTDVDLVQAQLRIASGATLADLGLSQDRIKQRGVAIQCRVTTEDPANDFRPDTGRITAYRSPGGAGIRLDDGFAYAGADVSPYFDSLLVKVTARGRDMATAIVRADRALAEIRVRGVQTNIHFLRAVLADPDFKRGNLSTAFIDERPLLTAASAGQDRASRLLDFLADVTVNRPHGPTPPGLIDPATKLPDLESGRPTAGSRQRLADDGPDAFARWLRQSPALAVTDTTMRDAHQSLLATRMRTYDIVKAARHVAFGQPQLLSLEVWGGATYDVALRFLHEDPWDRLAALSAAVPNICLQMLLRGQNAVGYSEYPPEVVRGFVAEARATGIDIFRIFDANNDVERMRPAIEAASEVGAVAEGTLCYTGDLHAPQEQRYTLDYYLRVAEQLVAAGAHVLCIKDMAGLLRAPAARTLVTALRSAFDQPVHLHTHDTAGGQLATYLAAVDAGVDAVDGASSPLAGTTSQPPLAAIVAATDGTPQATGLSLDAVTSLEPYWEHVRRLYRPFDAGIGAPTGTVYRHEIPGGQLSNLRQQALALGLADRFEEIEAAYAQCDALLGGLVKVTPTSKVVGDLALYAVSSGIRLDELKADPAGFDMPASVIGFLEGDLGVPPGGWPEPFRSKALRGRTSTATPPELTAGERAELSRPGTARRELLNDLLFPGPARTQRRDAQRWGDVSVVPTRQFLYGLQPSEELELDLEPGMRLLIELEAVGDADERGYRTAHVAVNGQVRPVEVLDQSMEAPMDRAERADRDDPREVAAPLSGVVTVQVAEGDEVKLGSPVAVIEAMKMQSTVSATAEGRVARVVTVSGKNVAPGDLLLVIR